MKSACRTFLLLLWLSLLADLAGASTAVRVEQVEGLTQAPVAGGFAELPAFQEPPAGDWRLLTLPEVGMPRSGLISAEPAIQTRYYRWSLPSALREQGGRLYLYLPRWQTVGQVAVYVDGQRRWQSSGDRVWNGFNQPVWVELSGDGPVPARQLLIRMDSVPGLGAGLASFQVGSEDALLWRYYWRLGLQSLLPPAIGIALLALGFFALAVWSRRRHESIYGLFFVASVFYLMRSLHYFGPLDPHLMPSEWFGWMTVNSLNGLVVTNLLFNLRLSEQRIPWLERGLLASVLACGLATLPVLYGAPVTASLSVASHLLLLLLSLLAMPLVIRFARRNGNRLGRLLAWSNVIALPVAVHDLLLQNYRLDLAQPYLLPYWQICFCLLFCYVLYRRYVTSVEGLERSREVLEARLAERETQLAASYAQLRDSEQREVLARERQRLMQDMHDGLGSALVGVMSMAARGEAAHAEIELALRDCLDELKLTIDSLEPLDSDLALLLASLRFRLQPRLEAVGIHLRWQVEPLPPLPWLAPEGAMHVLRIVQEVVANIIKHAEARVIRVAARADARGIALCIEDDGETFAPPPSRRGSGGRGVDNIVNRARALGGQVRWEAGVQGAGTRFSLWLPLRESDALERDSRIPGT